jgi:hypothetical protein
LIPRDSEVINNANNENQKPPLNAAAVMPPPSYSGPSTISFPVTLIDSAGQRWNIKYITTRRDNLRSGRLVHGWEKFCSTNGLRVGDMFEFTKLEAHELIFYGSRPGKDAIARVVAYKKSG